jgi:hypothetical protein
MKYAYNRNSRPIFPHVGEADRDDCVNDGVPVAYSLPYALDAGLELSFQIESSQLTLDLGQYIPCPMPSLPGRPRGCGSARTDLIGDMNEQVFDFCYLPNNQASQLMHATRFFGRYQIIVILGRRCPDLQERALVAVAGALAKAGQHEQAETLARSITDRDLQAQALAEVAKALVARGDTRQAYRMASAACAIGQWTTVLKLVLSLEPSALRVLTDL